MLVGIAISAALGPQAGSAEARGPHGSVHFFTLDAPALHDSHRHVRVYLPPSYDSAAAATRRYPAVYALHGWPGSDGNWVKKGHAADTLDRMIEHGRIPELIAIFPDGRGRGMLGRSIYMNSRDGSSQVARFVGEDLVAWADSTFRTRADRAHRVILGLSDGGTGAFNLAMQYPERFGAVGAHSSDFLLEKEMGMHGMVGSDSEATVTYAEHSPLLSASAKVARLRSMTLYFDCGLKDPALGENRAFHALLDSLGVPHTYREFPGSHSWHYWSAHLPDALEVLTAGMR